MAIALVATAVLLDPTPAPARRSTLSAPLRALRHRGLLTMSVTALLDNWGFFTMLGHAPVERPVASAAYGFVRFLAGGLASFAAGKLPEAAGVHLPFAVGAAAVVAGIAVLATGHRLLARADAGLDEDGATAETHGPVDDVAGEVADEFGGAPAAIDSEVHAGPRRGTRTSVP
jgi:hypothetical protein